MTIHRRSVSEFQKRLAQVEAGWDTLRLLRHAGEPESREGDAWRYSQRDGGLGCVRYAWFTFRIVDDKVVEVDSGGGHMTIE